MYLSVSSFSLVTSERFSSLFNFRFEEENFMRLPETKKDKKATGRGRQFGLTMGRLGDEITHDFGKSSFGEDFGLVNRKRKSKGSGKTKKKFKRRK